MIWNGLTLVQYLTLLLFPQMINKKETLQKVRIFNKPNNSSSIAEAIASINIKILVKLQPDLILQGARNSCNNNFEKSIHQICKDTRHHHFSTNISKNTSSTKLILSIVWLQAQPNILNIWTWSYDISPSVETCSIWFVFFDNGLWREVVVSLLATPLTDLGKT